MKGRAHLAACLWLAFVASIASAAPPESTVTNIIDGKSFGISSGETVRLAAIETPGAEDPLGGEAKAALSALIANKKVTVEAVTQAHDRHNRLIAQVYAGDTWVQGALLSQGFAMASIFADTPPDITTKMLAQEQAARAAKRGIWANSYYRIITPGEAGDFINRFKLVEGKVVSVHASRGNIYINFFDDWHGRFAGFIPRKYASAFTGLSSLAGKKVCLRGWIHYHNAPEMDLTLPEEIEVE